MKKLLFVFFITLIPFFSHCESKTSEIIDTPELPKEGEYVPGNPNGIDSDLQIRPTSGIASDAHPGYGIEKSFDGDMSSMYHSPWYSSSLPVTLEYNFLGAKDVDYIVYHPRTGGGNGDFRKFELWVSTEAKPDFEKMGDYDFKMKGTASVINFEKKIEGIKAFKFIVESGKNDFASCAEMEFYRKIDRNDLNMSHIFADDVYSQLRTGVTLEQINAIENVFFKNMAQSIFTENYPMEFRVQEYEPYPLIETTAKELKTSGYNPFENPTGMYFSSGDEIVIIMGDSKGEDISFRIHNFGNHADASFILRPGVNKVRAKNSGLGYVSYYTDNWRNVQPVKIHFASGKVNGYFNRNKHKREDWNKLIEGAVSTYFDIKGRYINLAYTTQDLREFCSNGMDLIEVYDEIVEIEHDLMGLIKYNKRPKNHMFARTVESGLFADGWGAGLAKGSMPDLVNPETIKKTSMWGIAHELGHVNQIRPGLKWVGTSETTNNVYSIIVRHHYTPDNINLERERVNDGDHHQLLGGRMNSYLNYGVMKGEPWQCQRGDNKMEDYQAGGDHFVRLCPLWQLMLYYRIANASWKKPDWYADVAEIVRNADEKGISDGQLQLSFMRNTMDVIGEDLTGFFETAGMLKPIDRHLDDYGGGNRITITQQDCDDLKAYASKYPKPQSPVIYYLTKNGLQAYEKRLPVNGTYGAGVTMYTDNKYGGDQYGIISHNIWKNVAVFETYQGNILTKVSMVGLDSDDLNTTLVWYPPGSTRIEAVAWDGTRTLVYGER